LDIDIKKANRYIEYIYNLAGEKKPIIIMRNSQNIKQTSLMRY